MVDFNGKRAKQSCRLGVEAHMHLARGLDDLQGIPMGCDVRLSDRVISDKNFEK